MPVDTDKLVKVMNMLESSFENERLVAIGRAQKMVKDGGQTWEQLLRSKATIPNTNYVGMQQLANAQRAGFQRGYQEGMRAGQRIAATNIARQLDEAYKRGVRETLDKNSEMKGMLQRAYERGRQEGLERLAQAMNDAYERGKRDGTNDQRDKADKHSIKWDVFCANALNGEYGELTTWEKEFMTSLINFPKVSPKQLNILKRMASEAGFRGTVLA